MLGAGYPIAMTDPAEAIAELVRDNGQLQDRVCELEMRVCALAAFQVILLTLVAEGRLLPAQPQRSQETA
jgi:hypothetical protein